MFKIISDQNQDLGKCTKEHDETIYQGILNTQIKLVKGFSLMTSAIGISCQPILLLNMQQNSGNIAVMAGAGAFLSFFTFATPLLIHHMSKKYVTEMNYNKLEDTYTAITYSLFLRRKEVCNVTKYQETGLTPSRPAAQTVYGLSFTSAETIGEGLWARWPAERLLTVSGPFLDSRYVSWIL